MDYVRNRLANKRDLKKFRKMYTDEDPHYNHIFAENIAMSLNNLQTNRNHNVLVVGGTGTGTGKTGKYLYPNIMQCNASMVINDPDGLTFEKFAPYLIQNGYMVYHFDAAEPDCSSHYNPLMNVYDKDGNISPVEIDVLVDLCMKNAKASRKKGGGDPFWEKAEKAFLTAVIYYVLENDDIPVEDKCFHTVLEKVRQTRKGPESDQQEDNFDKEFTSWREKCEKAGREIKAPIYYDVYLMAPEETAKVIVKTTQIDLQFFADRKIDALTRHKSEYKYTHKQIDFDTIAQYPTALFVRIPKGNTLLSDLFYTQLYTRLYAFGERISYHKYLIRGRKGDSAFACFDTMSEAVHFKKHATIIERKYQDGYSVYHIVDHGKIYRSCVNREALETVLKRLPEMEVEEKVNYPGLPIHVDFYLDEFESISPIPNFLTILATCRKYRIGNHILLQEFEWARKIYPGKEYETLLANVDTTIFLGSLLNREKEEIQDIVGTTVVGRGFPGDMVDGACVYLLSISDIEQLNQNRNDNCIVLIRDVPPIIAPKAFLINHPDYAKFTKTEKINLKSLFCDLVE